MSNLANVTGAVTNIAGLAFTVGALGLTLGFVDRALDRATRRSNGKRRSSRPLFDTMPKNNVFSLPKQKRRNNAFDTELFSF